MIGDGRVRRFRLVASSRRTRWAGPGPIIRAWLARAERCARSRSRSAAPIRRRRDT